MNKNFLVFRFYFCFNCAMLSFEKNDFVMTESSNFISENEANNMQSNQSTMPEVSISDNEKSFTPRELIRYHIENPEVPITDDDIRNLNLKKERVVDFVADEFSRD